MSHDAGAKCLCVVNHSPNPLELEHHHIWPQGMGGPSTPDNLVWVCPSAHTNAHELMRLILKRGSLTWTEATAIYDVPVSRYAFQLAHEGVRRYRARSVA